MINYNLRVLLLHNLGDGHGPQEQCYYSAPPSETFRLRLDFVISRSKMRCSVRAHNWKVTALNCEDTV